MAAVLACSGVSRARPPFRTQHRAPRSGFDCRQTLLPSPPGLQPPSPAAAVASSLALSLSVWAGQGFGGFGFEGSGLSERRRGKRWGVGQWGRANWEPPSPFCKFYFTFFYFSFYFGTTLTILTQINLQYLANKKSRICFKYKIIPNNQLKSH